MNIEEAKKVLSYDPTTGLFTWLETRGRRVRGARAGSYTKNGYLEIGILGTKWLCHRLAFLYMEEVPPVTIDHVNGQRDDNRWVNLREATDYQNAQNSKKATNNTSGYKWASVIRSKGKVFYRYSMLVNGVRYEKCGFPSLLAAHLEAAKLHKKLCGEFTRSK